VFQHVRYKTQKPIHYKAQTALNSNILKRPLQSTNSAEQWYFKTTTTTA